MAWCHQATSHYLSQCWPRSLSPYDVTRPQWVNGDPKLWPSTREHFRWRTWLDYLILWLFGMIPVVLLFLRLSYIIWTSVATLNIGCYNLLLNGCLRKDVCSIFLCVSLIATSSQNMPWLKDSAVNEPNCIHPPTLIHPPQIFGLKDRLLLLTEIGKPASGLGYGYVIICM